MKLLSRLSAALLALALLAAVVWLGIRSGKDPRFVIWFGIASAIVAPVGLSLFSYVISRPNSDLVQRLASVPEIQGLMAKAQTQEEKIRVLEQEHSKLVEVIRVESQRLAAKERIETLEREGVRIIQELDALDAEVRSLDGTVRGSVAREEIGRLRDRVKARERGDVILRLGSRVYRVDRDIIKAMPMGMGNLTLGYFRIFEKVQERIRLRRGKRMP
jgi:hypothetical protein